MDLAELSDYPSAKISKEYFKLVQREALTKIYFIFK